MNHPGSYNYQKNIILKNHRLDPDEFSMNEVLNKTGIEPCLYCSLELWPLKLEMITDLIRFLQRALNKPKIEMPLWEKGCIYYSGYCSQIVSTIEKKLLFSANYYWNDYNCYYLWAWTAFCVVFSGEIVCKIAIIGRWYFFNIMTHYCYFIYYYYYCYINLAYIL